MSDQIITKQRSSNIELYRIIVMLLIISHHYVVNSGLMTIISQDPLSTNSLFFTIFGAWGKTGINCFVLITGWFMCKTNITLRKFLKLLLEVLTYSVCINFSFIACGYHPDGIGQMLLSIIPMRYIGDGFTSAFLVFYLCIPFLNVLLKGVTKRQHQYLIALMLFIYTLHTTVPHLMDVSMNYVSWFSTLYFIAAYFRFYPYKADNTRFWGIATLISWGLSIASIIFLTLLQVKMGKKPDVGLSYFLISDSNAILALFNGVTSFMWFLSMKMPNNNAINSIAASTFGVFLIHTNSDTMRQFLWRDLLNCIGHYDTNLYWLYSILCVLAIYAICTVIDIIRIHTVETHLLNTTERACNWVYSKLNKSIA